MNQTRILTAVIGSHAYGLATERSDVDRRGVFTAPSEAFWALDKPATSATGPREEELHWELEHFCRLALNSNPTVIELLVTRHVEHCAPLGEELRGLLPHFLSLRAVIGYRRATTAQLTRAGTNLKPKQLMHVIRLRLVCLDLLRTGTLRIEVGEHRDRLLAVQTGDTDWAQGQRWAERLRVEIEQAEQAGGPLPAEPGTEVVDRWLVSVRKRLLVG